MMRFYVLFSVLIILNPASLKGNKGDHHIEFEWKRLNTILPAPGNNKQSRLSGAFSGIHNSVMIIAGGATFPDGRAWESGDKAYQQDIYVLEKKGPASFEWVTGRQFELPEKVAYGLSIETAKGLACLGGTNGKENLAEAYLLKWNPVARLVEMERLPSLPLPMANLSGAAIGEMIYVAASKEGENQKYFWRLNLSDPSSGWQPLPVWPGSARTNASGVGQSNGEYYCFYLMRGRHKGQEGISRTLSDIQVYNPVFNSWETILPDEEGRPHLPPLSGGTAVPFGANHILFFGGIREAWLNRLEALASQIESEQDSMAKQNLIAARDSILIHQPGFSEVIWAFHTITQSWVPFGSLPPGGQGATAALKWDDQLLIFGGEIAPGIPGPDMLTGRLAYQSNFGRLNSLVLGSYLFLLVLMGIYLSRNQQTTDDFFKGGQRIPWWAAGLSIFGTQLSAITFMAIPAKTYATNWLYFILSMTIIMAYPFIIRYFLPFYRRFNLTSAYEYLELRFNLSTRLFGSMLYVLLQLGRLGIVLLLPSLALSVVANIDVSLCILMMGGMSILYTVLGGIEAVIWTDVLQVAVLMGGAILSLILLYANLEPGAITAYIDRFDKMQIFDFSFDLTTATFWVVLFGGFASNLVQYGSDQTIIQRYLTTKDEKAAARSIATGAWMALPATLIFFSLGTLLFVFYKINPEALNPALEKTDAIFPWYIITNLPDGVSGILIAAIFAASMSSLDSSMNSVATVLTTDFFRRLRPQEREARYLNLARWITVIVGLAGTALALAMASWGISSLWDQFNMIVGLFAGGLGGVFLLGIFSKRTNGSGALAGLVVSAVVQYFVKEYTSIHFLLYALTGMCAAVVVGYVLSLFTGSNTPSASDYTIFSIKNFK